MSNLAVLIPACGMPAGLLRNCISSVEESANRTGIPVTIMVDKPEPDALYNKSKALNRLLDRAVEAGAEVIATLDADCLVGPLYVEAVHQAGSGEFDRICFIVRESQGGGLRFFGFPTPYHDGRAAGPVKLAAQSRVFGNALWAARVDKLRGQRWNEDLEGRGFEDLEHTCRIVTAGGGLLAWKGGVHSNPEYGITHVTHKPRQWSFHGNLYNHIQTFNLTAEAVH